MTNYFLTTNNGIVEIICEGFMPSQMIVGNVI